MKSALIDIRRPVTVCKASAGTGKTYTLAAYYVGLLLSNEDYRSILAITFTNKATAEMSERILSYLHQIAQGEGGAFLERARQFMLRDNAAPDSLLAQRAAECFKRMLLDFDNVHVMTIDSFLQTLLSGLASVLQMNSGLNTELDIDHVIRQAVDQLLTTDLTAADRAILEDYMQLKLDQESHWDVRKSLCEMAKELYNESVQMLDANGQICFDAAMIARRREAIEQEGLGAEGEQLAQVLAGIDTSNLVEPTAVGTKLLPHVKDINNACARLNKSLADPRGIKSADRFRGLTATQYTDAQAGKWTKIPASVVDAILRATDLAKEVAHRYNTRQLTIRFSRDMELMSSLQALIQRNLSDANSALLAHTASTLSKALRAGDADFILEKAGIRYHHVLMDEFQDTSRLQWNVIRQLLQDLLAGTGNTLLIVGDIKQSIYRWRNGDWHIMDSLTNEGVNGLMAERVNERFTSLTQNFRSSEEVVRFNLSLFDHIIRSAHDPLIERIYNEGFSPDEIERFYQSKKKKGGYASFQAFPGGTKEDLTYDMFEQIESLLERGARPSDIMILVREKKEAALIVDEHAEYRIQNTEHRLAQTNIVSADSFLLEASEAVQLVIAGLRVMEKNDEVAAGYIGLITQKPELIEQIRTITRSTPLYETVCELIKILLCDEDGQYHGTETAYINNLLDRTRSYVSAYGSNVEDFLTYWDDTLHAKSIPVSSNDAIQIMTVHASKGLQAQTLFVPFCMWPKEAGRHPQKIWCEVAPEIEGNDFVPIQDGAEMADSAYQTEYEEEHTNMRIDNLNMLYVALTRAEDNLFVSTAYSVTKDGQRGACNHVGQYIMDFVGDSYEAGEVVIRDTVIPESRDTEPLTAELWANSDQVRFVQSQEGAMYTEYGDEAYRRVARMDEGTLCHEIFAHLRKADELEPVLDDFETRGEIQDKTQRENLRQLIASAWEGNEQMRDWFTAPWELRLEEAIYIDRRELRPDRVMINPLTNEAVVLDYKFGIWEDKYITQVRDYMEALRRIGYKPVQGYLWFARQNRLVRVNGE